MKIQETAGGRLAYRLSHSVVYFLRLRDFDWLAAMQSINHRFT